MVQEKVISIAFDNNAFPGFTLKLAYLGQEKLSKLRKTCTYDKFDRKTKTTSESLDEEAFIVEFSKAVVRDWEGFKVEYLEYLMLVDTSTSENGDDLIEYSKENAEALLRNSTEFLNWINEVVFDLTNFRGTSVS